MKKKSARSPLPEGIIAFLKRDCPTCGLVVPVLRDLAREVSVTIFTQDDRDFPADLNPVDDTDLKLSYQHGIEVVPTLLRVQDGVETDRTVGWHRGDWEALTGQGALGPGLPDLRPGCGSLSVEPEIARRLQLEFADHRLQARRVALGGSEDEMESLYERGWTDGLPVVPPTEARVLAMLEGTDRDPDEIVASVPPDLKPCRVEKVAINAVMAGCKPEYLPVVLAAVEAACTETFNMHGLLATTMTAGPVLVVNGPIRKALGMNAGRNVFGQGNRPNSTIGRALQLVVRNVGGGRPGEIDRATFGNPGKVGFCFAEDEEGSPWAPLSTDLGIEAGRSAVTLFAGEGPRTIVDQLARDPESLARSFAMNLRSLHHPKAVMAFDCLLAVGPEHARVFAEAGWTKSQLIARLHELLLIPTKELVRGADGVAEGVPDSIQAEALPKFRPGGILVVYCGGEAGLFSAMIGGWVTGEMGSQPVIKEIAG